MVFIAFVFQDTYGTFAGDNLPVWNPIKILDINHVIRTLNRMAKKVTLFELRFTIKIK